MTELESTQGLQADSRVLDGLRERFACDFGLWLKDGTDAGEGGPRNSLSAAWRCAPRDLPLDLRNSDASVTDVLAELEAGHRPVVRNLRDGRILVAVPLDADGDSRRAAVGLSRLSPIELAAELATATRSERVQELRIARREDEVRLFARQMTANFDELNRFRTLAQNLDLCNPTNHLNLVAERMLPNLKKVVNADAILLVRPGETDGDFEFHVTSGASGLSESHCRQFLNSIVDDAREGPYLWNDHNGVTAGTRGGLGVRSCILAPVSKGAFDYGWLLALKRSPSTPVGNSPLANDRVEFGMHEASLLQSAARMLATQAFNARSYNEQRGLLVNVIRAMVSVIDARDPYTCGHSDRVAVMSRQLAMKLGLPTVECEQIYISGLLHDIGKVSLPDKILLKPGRLTTEEFEVIKEHPVRGYEILSHVKQLQLVLPGVLHHHESWDGTGYPHRLKGAEIPVMARIMAVCDAFDAMTSDRPYRSGMPVNKAIGILRDGAGQQWEAAAARTFLEHYEAIHDACSDWQDHVADMKTVLDDDADDIEASIDDSVLQAVAQTHG